MKCLSENRAFGGVQGVYRHNSNETNCPMTFSVYVPPQAKRGPVPVLTFLSGLTCTHANVTEKGEYRRACGELGIMFVAPDTSPRGEGVPDDPNGAYDFGLGAGFYVDATEPAFARHYRMYSYIAHELPQVLARHFPAADLSRQGILGHSMGGHGALTLALTRKNHYRSVSAFAPIVAPSEVPWGQKALQGYLGAHRDAWRRHDAVALLRDGARVPGLLVDQGEDDDFLRSQLRPELLEAACAAAQVPLTLRRQPGYDHSYYFISTFLAEHVAWHAERL